MSTYQLAPAGARYRATIDASSYQDVPVEAQDSSVAGRVHWWAPATAGASSWDGAIWALQWSLSLIFGDTIGQVLTDATLSNLEVWNGQEWLPA